MEGVLNGCPSFAVSQEYVHEPDFTLAAMARLIARNILEHGLAPDELLNVNVPRVEPDEFDGVEVTRLGRRVYQDQLVERVDPRGIPYYWIGGPAPSGLPAGHRLLRGRQPAHRGHADPARPDRPVAAPAGAHLELGAGRCCARDPGSAAAHDRPWARPALRGWIMTPGGRSSSGPTEEAIAGTGR